MAYRVAIFFLPAASLVLAACASNAPAPEIAVGQCQAPEVREVVERFGERLKRVSLLAPEPMVRQGIRENYEPLVTPELLRRWLDHPTRAPGRRVSSPWPARIHIDSVESAGAGSCVIKGGVIYLTSVELTHGGAAARQPVALRVREKNERWRISSYSGGNILPSPQPSP
ncbi:MAG TPA: hypothetical protein VFK24_07115 [Gammaproteobacteria bacterium]|nr:hypothetical protein [Gammaproteobacteria bacterium]